MGKGVATTVKYLYDFNTETIQVLLRTWRVFLWQAGNAVGSSRIAIRKLHGG